MYPFTTHSKGINSNILGKEIEFESASPIINIAVLQENSISKFVFAKEKQITFPQIELVQGSTEEKLVIKKIQQKIKNIKKLFEDYVYADVTNDF